MKIFVIIVAK